MISLNSQPDGFSLFLLRGEKDGKSDKAKASIEDQVSHINVSVVDHAFLSFLSLDEDQRKFVLKSLDSRDSSELNCFPSK